MALSKDKTDQKEIEGTASKKWFWKMEYCRKHRLPPAQAWAWDEAEKAFSEQFSEHRST